MTLKALRVVLSAATVAVYYAIYGSHNVGACEHFTRTHPGPLERAFCAHIYNVRRGEMEPVSYW